MAPFSLYPKTRREWLKSLARAGGFLAVFLFIAFLVADSMRSMPGKSWTGALPPLTEPQRDLSARLRTHVEHLAVEIGLRNLHNYRGLENAAQYVEHSLAEDGLTTSAQHYDCYGVDVRNVVAEIPGRSRPAEIVLLGAHYDSFGDSPAANDNATGVAAVLEIARMLHDQEFERTIRFVGFVNEEPPFFWTEKMGSLVYARACRERGDNIVAMLTPETIGCYSDAKGSQKYPFPFKLAYPSQGNFVGFVGDSSSKALVQRSIASFRKHASFPSEGVAAPRLIQGIGWSDHWSFWQAGYPGLMVTDTAPFRYPYYHTPEDTPDKIDFDRLARVVEGLAGVVADLAGSS